jgi:hypothetical protein
VVGDDAREAYVVFMKRLVLTDERWARDRIHLRQHFTVEVPGDGRGEVRRIVTPSNAVAEVPPTVRDGSHLPDIEDPNPC